MKSFNKKEFDKTKICKHCNQNLKKITIIEKLLL